MSSNKQQSFNNYANRASEATGANRINKAKEQCNFNETNEVSKAKGAEKQSEYNGTINANEADDIVVIENSNYGKMCVKILQLDRKGANLLCQQFSINFHE